MHAPVRVESSEKLENFEITINIKSESVVQMEKRKKGKLTSYVQRVNMKMTVLLEAKQHNYKTRVGSYSACVQNFSVTHTE